MDSRLMLALVTVGTWLLAWAIGIVIRESIGLPWYRQGGQKDA